MGNTAIQPRARKRGRIATALAAAGALVASTGLVLMTAASPASATDTNHPGHWEQLQGEKCAKVDDKGAESGGYTITKDPDAGYVYSKIILKKGSGNSQGEENTVTYNPVKGQTYFHLSGKGYSHVILCQVPKKDEEPKATKVMASVSYKEPTCADKTVDYNGNDDAPAGVVSYSHTGNKAPGGTITVTATIGDAYKDEYEFANKSQSLVFAPHEFGKVPTNCETDKTVPVPGEPSVKDPCGPDNISFVVPQSTDKVEWELEGNGKVLKATTKHGYKFEDGDTVKTYTLPKDSNEPCDDDDDEDEIEVVASVSYDEPDCDDDTVGYTGRATIDGSAAPAGLVTFSHTGDKVPGGTITVTATISDDDYEFDNEKQTWTFPEHTFKDVPEDCDTSSTPPASPEPSETTAPPAVVPPVVGGTESSAPQPTKPNPGQVKGTESSKPKPHANKPKGQRPAVVLGTEAAVPTAVDAGLGSLPGAAPAQGSLLGQLLTGAGVALMLAAGWLMTMGRRKVGSREA